MTESRLGEGSLNKRKRDLMVVLCFAFFFFERFSLVTCPLLPNKKNPLEISSNYLVHQYL